MATDTAVSHTLAGARERTASHGERDVLGVNQNKVAKFLGWFSIGLGTAELVAPRAMARLVGCRKNHDGLLRFFGMREIGAGIAILKSSNPTPGLWSRVAGDMVDLAYLSAVLAASGSKKDRAITATAAVAGVTALDILCATRISAGSWDSLAAANAQAEANLLVNRPTEECYRFWRDFENLSGFMSYVDSVRVTGDGRSHWTAHVPGGARMEWDAEVTEDVPNERISWRSLPGSDVDHSGSVEFEQAPGNRGTIVRMQMDYGNAAHVIGSALAKAVGKDPEQVMYKDLRRFKQLLETGEVITTEGQSAGRGSSTTWLDSIAR